MKILHTIQIRKREIEKDKEKGERKIYREKVGQRRERTREKEKEGGKEREGEKERGRKKERERKRERLERDIERLK